MSSVPRRADAVVLGAGVAGAAAAWALRRRGLRTIVLERGARPGEGASGRSASMVREDADDPVLAYWTARGAAWHRREEVSAFRPTGSFLIGPGDEEASERVPIATGRGRFNPGDGVVDVGALVASLLEDADVRCRVEATSLEPVKPGGGAVRVVTSGGVLEAGIVVNAAGAWAGRIGDLPLEPRKRHLFRTRPRAVDESWPFVWDLERGFYFRAAGDSLLACACDDRPSAPGDTAVELDAESRLREVAAQSQPKLFPLEIASCRAGQRTFAPDGRFVVGWDPRTAGVFWLAALGGHGITAAPALAEAAAALIADAGAAPDALAALSPERLLA